MKEMDRRKKTSLVQTAYKELKLDIMENKMSPGFQATEVEIAKRLNISRTPTHEALLRLQAEGLIEVIPRRGVRILPISLSDMKEIYNILSLVEPEAAASLAASKPSLESLSLLEKAMIDMEEMLEKGDLSAWAVADDHLHRTLMQLHGNKRLAAFVNNLYDQAHRARIATLSLRKPPLLSNKEHREIFDFIKAGKERETRKAFRAHRERATKELMDILEKFKQIQL